MGPCRKPLGSALQKRALPRGGVGGAEPCRKLVLPGRLGHFATASRKPSRCRDSPQRTRRVGAPVPFGARVIEPARKPVGALLRQPDEVACSPVRVHQEQPIAVHLHRPYHWP